MNYTSYFCVIFAINPFIMLIKFSIRNYKTFKDKVELSLIASNYDKTTRESENVIAVPQFNLRLLKSAVIYGANASGKTKLLEAFQFMKNMVINSFKDTQKDEAIDVEPFLLHSESEKEPSEFEIIFIHENEMYRYGFEVNEKVVVSEWLYHKPNTKEIELFNREGQEFEINSRKFPHVKTLVEKKFIRNNSLLLSVASQFNLEKAEKILQYFKKLKILSGLDHSGYKGFTMSKTKNTFQKKKILELLQLADLGIHNFDLAKFELGKLPKEFPFELKEMLEKEIIEGNDVYSDTITFHKKYNSDLNHIEDIQFFLEKQESSGTQKYFSLSGPILDAIENGHILIVDELDSKLHPNLVCKIIEIFNSNELNPNNAQLIFNTHDTNLLSSGKFRRDQIWFTEKDRYGAASLYSLEDFKDVRKDENYENNYIRGKYGAIPYLGDFNSIFNRNSVQNHENEE